jgi:hypothetical protein
MPPGGGSTDLDLEKGDGETGTMGKMDDGRCLSGA